MIALLELGVVTSLVTLGPGFHDLVLPLYVVVTGE